MLTDPAAALDPHDTSAPAHLIAPSARFRRLDIALLALVAAGQFVLGRYLYLSAPLLVTDDEGYMTIMIREWSRQGGLYDRVFSQYGPFHALLFGAPVKLLNLDLTYAMGRTVTLCLQIGACVLFAIAVRSITGSLWPAIGAQCGAFLLLSSLASASLHPGALIMFLLAALAANITVLRPRVPWWSDVLTGCLAAALALTKVNVGVMVVVALAYVAAIDLPDRRVRRWLLPVTELAVLLLGPALFVFQLPLIRKLPAPISVLNQYNEPVTLLHWGLLYLSAAAGVLVASRRNPVGRGGGLGPVPMLVGFAGAAGAIVAAILIAGTSPRALIEGVFLRPTEQANALAILAPNTPWSIVWLPVTVLGVWLCGRLLARESTPAMLWASAAARLVAAFLLVSAVPQVNNHLGLAIFRYPFIFLPLVAVVLLPTFSAGRTSTILARRVLAVLALTHSLHAFPVAGAQVSWSLTIPVVLAFVVAADGVRELQAVAPHPQPVVSRWLAIGGRAVVVAAALTLLLRASSPWRSAYRAGVPVAPAAMSSLRLPAKSASDVEWLRSAASSCDVLVSRPGFNWSYAALDQLPPTGFNATLWPRLLSDAEQQAIVDRLESTDGTVCYVVDDFSVAFEPSFSATAATGPLVDYLGSQPFKTISSHNNLRLAVIER